MRVEASRLWFALLFAVALHVSGCGHGWREVAGVPEVVGDGSRQVADVAGALAVDANDPDAWATLAAVHLRRGELVAASEASRRALAGDPDHVGATVLAARLEARAGHAERALSFYDRALATRPTLESGLLRERVDAMMDLAEAFAARGEADHAAAMLRAVDEVGPGAARARRASAWLATSALYVDQEASDLAAAAVERARALGGDDDALAYASAAVKLVAGAPVEAAEALADWASRGDDPGARWMRVGGLLSAHGRHDEAHQAYVSAAKARPTDAAPLIAAAHEARFKDFGAATRDLFEAAARTAKASPKRAVELLWIALARGYDGYALPARAAQLSLRDPATVRWVTRAVQGPRSEYGPLARAWCDAYPGDEGTLLAAVAMLLQPDRTDHVDGQEALALLTARAPDSRSTAVALAWAEAAAASVHPRRGPALSAAAAREFADAVEGRIQDDPGALYRLANARRTAGDADGARRIGQRLTEVPGGAGYSVLLGSSLRSPATPRAAAAEVVAATAPQDADPGFALVAARWLHWHDRLAAIAYYEAALASPDQEVVTEAHGALADLYAKAVRGRMDDEPTDRERATKHLRAWLALVPSELRAGELLFMRKRWRDISEVSFETRLVFFDALAALLPEDEEVAADRFGVIARLALHNRERWIDPLRRAGDHWQRVATRPSLAAVAVGMQLHPLGLDAEAAALLSRAAPEQLAKRLSHARLAAFFQRADDVERVRRHAALFIAQDLNRESDVDALVEFAEQLLAWGQPDLAVQAARRVLAADLTPRVGPTYALARGLLRTGQVAEARALLDDFVDHANEPQGMQTRRLRRLGEATELLEREGQRHLAAEVREERLADGLSTYREGSDDVASTFRELGDVAAVDRIAHDVARSRSGAVTGAWMLISIGDLEEARRLLLEGQAKARGEREDGLTGLLFRTAVHRGDRGEAVAAARTLLAPPDPRRRRGVPSHDRWTVDAILATLVQNGMADGALELLADADAEPATEVARARARFAMGEPAEAHAGLVTALTDAKTADAILDAATARYREAGQLERLRELRSRALAAGASSSEHTIALAVSLLSAEREDEGRALLDRYLADHPDGALRVANALADDGCEVAALDLFERALGAVGGEPGQEALRRAAKILARRGGGARLDALVERYLAPRDGTPGPSLAAVGDAYARVGRPVDAIAWYERAAQDAPSAEVLWTLGAMKDARGDDTGARAAFTRHAALWASTHETRWPDERDAPPVVRVVERYLDSGRAGDALALLQGVADGKRPWVAALTARAHLAAGDEENLLAGFDRGWRLGWMAPAQSERLAAALLDRGRVADAWTVASPLRSDRRSPPRLVAARAAAADGRVLEVGPPTTMLRRRDDVRGDALEASALADLGFLTEARARLREILDTPGAGLGPDLAAVLARIDPAWPPVGEGGRRPVPSRRPALERDQMTARVAFERGAYREAIAALDYPLAAAYPDPAPWSLALRAATQLGDRTALTPLITRLERRRGTRSASLDEAVAVLYRASAYALALEVLDRALEIERGAYRRRLLGVELALALGRRDDAARRAERLVADVLDGPAVRIALAEIYARWMYLDDARGQLAHIRGSVGPAPAERERVAATVAALAGDDEAMRAACAAAVAASGGDPWARVRCARALADAGGAWPVVAEVVAPALDGEPDHAALALAAVAGWRAGDLGAGRAVWVRLRARFPFEAGPVRELLAGAVAGGDAQSAAEIAVHARRVDALDVVGVATVAAEALAAGADEAMRALVASLLTAAEAARGPGDVAVATGWARLEATGTEDPGAAVRALEVAWSRRPRSARAAVALTRALSEPGGDAARALAVADLGSTLPEWPLGESMRLSGLQVAPGSRSPPGEGVEYPLPSLLDAKAWALHRLGRDAEALALEDRALHLLHGEDRGEGGEIVAHRAELLAALGRACDAELAWRDCASRGPASTWGRRCRTALHPGTTPR